MNSSHTLFLLMADLSQLHDGEKITRLFLDGINEIFSPVEFAMSGNGEGDDHSFEIKTKNSQFGCITIKDLIGLQQEDEILLDNAIHMLAVILERQNFETKLQEEKNSLAKVAEESLSELRDAVQELQSARNASMNLIEDLTDEIEKRTRYEEGLKESEEKYRNLFHNHVAVKLIIDPDTGAIADANESAANFYGWDIDRLKQMNLSQIDIMPEEELKGEIQKALHSKTFNFEFKHRKADGTIVDVGVFSSGIIIGGKKYLHSIIHDVTEKKKAERALRASERNYRSLIDGMTETVWVIDFDGNLIDVNRAATEVLGYTKEELLPIGIYGIDSSLNNKEIAALVQNMPKDKLQILETSHKTKDGKIFPVEIYSSVVKYQGKESILSIARDVSIRKRMEKQIRESEETIRLLFDSTAEGIYGIDLEGNCTFCNQAAIRMLGYADESEIVGRNIHRLIHHTRIDGSIHPVEACEIFKALKKASNTHAADEVLWKKNGAFFPVEYWSYPIKREGRLTGSVVTFIDITQRKRDFIIQRILYKIARTSMSTKALEDIIPIVRQELSNVFDIDHFHLALYKSETDTLERIVYMNENPELKEWKAGNSLSGYVIRTGKSLLLKKEELKRFLAENDIEYTGTIAECWMGVPLTDEKEAIGVIVAQSYSDPQAYDEGSIRLLEMIAHELTIVIQKTKMVQDLIKAKEKAEESDRLKSAFLTNMSHEIRTPMNGILGFLDLLKEPDLEEENRIEYIDIVNESGQRLLDTINDIIEISKIEAGIIDVNNKEVNVAERMKFLHHFFKPQTNQKGLELEIPEYISGPEAIIKTDSSKLDGILINLIKNSIKFTNRGSIQMGNYLQNGSLVFYVKDSGRGIPADRIEAIFERFVQGDLNLTRAHEGSGLGLAITKAYVNALGGKIWVKSEEGIGSTFFFSIPYNSVKKPESADNSIPMVSLQKCLTILIAEDDETSFKFLKTALSYEYVNILHTENGQDTVKAVKEIPGIDFVLMDIKMSGMDGLEATRQIRKFNKTMPIIAQSAYALSGDDEKAKEAGCNGYLSKPISRIKLIDLINSIREKSIK